MKSHLNGASKICNFTVLSPSTVYYDNQTNRIFHDHMKHINKNKNIHKYRYISILRFYRSIKYFLKKQRNMNKYF